MPSARTEAETPQALVCYGRLYLYLVRYFRPVGTRFRRLSFFAIVNRLRRNKNNPSYDATQQHDPPTIQCIDPLIRRVIYRFDQLECGLVIGVDLLAQCIAQCIDSLIHRFECGLMIVVDLFAQCFAQCIDPFIRRVNPLIHRFDLFAQ